MAKKTTKTAVAKIDSNEAETPFDGWKIHAHDLFDEAKNWVDGDPIENEGQAQAITELLSQIQAHGKLGETHRKDEKKPLDDAVK